MKFRKSIAALLCTAVLAGVFTGCGKKDMGSGETEEPGRYMETRTELSGEMADWTVRQLFTSQDRLHILAVKQEDGKTRLREWAQQGETFEDVTQGWLASLELPTDKAWLDISMAETKDGIQYLMAGYEAVGEEYYMAHLWKGQNETAQDITPQKWRTFMEDWDGYPIPSGMAALEGGMLAVLCFPTVDIYSGEDGSLTESWELSGQYDAILANGNDFYLYGRSGTGTVGTEIIKCRDGKYNAAETIAFPMASGNVDFCVCKDGTLMAAGNEGIYKGTEGADGFHWEKLMEGVETDFSLTDYWCTGLAVMEDGKLYAMFQGPDSGKTLNRYEYDPDAVWEVKENLKLYAVYDSSILKQAAVMYHRTHPEVMITIESAYPMYYDGETDYNAIYQNLNTTLMGEEAPDILVMDHLDMDSYADKGLLEDIGDVVEPLEEEGRLLSNVTGAYLREDGSRYAVPLQFAFPMIVGRNIGAGDMESMETLAAFLEGQEDRYLSPRTVLELVDQFYPYFCREMVRDKRLDQEVLGRYLDAMKIIGNNCGIIDSRDEKERASNVWDLASEVRLAIEDVAGFNECMLPISIADYMEGELAAFENCFIPSVQMGICTKSSHKETAKDFLEFALSETVQGRDYYSGFPVNAASLEVLAGRDRSDAEAEATIELAEGVVEFKILDYPAETAKRLLEICRGLQKPAGEDAKIREVLAEALEGYLKDTQSRDETVNRIEEGLKMYLAE